MVTHDNKLLEELLQDETCHGKCLASMVFQYIPLGDDMLLQLKMVEKFKYIWSNDAGYDIGFEYAFKRFSHEHAKKYRDLWESDNKYHHVDTMFNELIGYGVGV